MTRKLLICVAAMILIAAFSTSTFAQARASLRGVISDEFGAAIVGATVTLKDADVDVATGRRDPVNIGLKIAAIESQVKVNAETPLSTDSSNNANQTVI